MHGPRSGSLALLFLLLAITTLSLTACNSGSGSSPKAGTASNTIAGAETPTPDKAPAKGTIAEALANQLKSAP